MTILNDLGPHSNRIYTSIVNQEIISSTPITNKIFSFEINSTISPIRTPIKNDNMLSTELYFEDYNLKNMKNKTQIDKCEGQISSISLELSGVNVLNTSQLLFNDVQNYDLVDSKNMDDTESQMFFISRNPKHIQFPNDTLSYENDLSNMGNEESLKSLTKGKNFSISIYFDNLKKVECKESTFTPNKLSQEEKSTEVSKECLSEKIKKKLSPKLEATKTHRIKKNKHKTKKFHFKSKMNKSWKRKKKFFSEFSFSDSDKTLHTSVKIKGLWTNKCRSKIEQDSLKLECNDTWIKNIKNLSADLESPNYNNTENMMIHTNSSLKLNLSKEDKNMKYYNESNISHKSSSIFSNDSIFLPNSNNKSPQFQSNKYKCMNESQGSCSSSYYFKENYSNNNKITVSFSKILFEDIPETTSKINLVSIKYFTLIDTIKEY